MAIQRTIAPKKPARHFADGGTIGADGLRTCSRSSEQKREEGEVNEL